MNRALAALATLALLLTACGDDDATTTQPNPDATVSVGDGGELGEILVDSSGRALYTAEEEDGGTVLCAGSCLEAWPPLTVPSSDEPTAGDGVDGTLATLTRDDGTVQVTYDGSALYTFNADAAGEVSGHGISDEFDGVTLTWQVATPSGQAPDDADEGPGYTY